MAVWQELAGKQGGSSGQLTLGAVWRVGWSGAREATMKRTVCAALFLLCSCASVRAQRSVDGLSSRPRQISPMATEASELQWMMAARAENSLAGAYPGDAPGGIVSVDTLKVPDSAIKEMQRFFKDFDAGKLDSAVKHLSKAITVYPGWAAAHHNLGQTYARMGNYDQATVEFENAARLDTKLVRPWLGLSKVYFLQKKYSDGETAARRALEIDPVNGDAQYFLARNLISNGQETPEALELIRKSKDQYAVSRLILANVYLRHGAVDEAVAELRGYAAQPNVEARERVLCMVRHLTEPEGTVTCSMK
jgi:tetratricopeptide (TPR) repeat protein